MKNFDVIVIGAGPAGIFSALELANSGLKVLILEKGRDIGARACPIHTKGVKCISCKPCGILCGWGGAGAHSDGKLTLTTEFGGMLDLYMEKPELAKLIDYVDGIYLKFGATQQVYGDDNKALIRKIQKDAASADLSLIPARIRHLGTDKCVEILSLMRDYLEEKCTIRTSDGVAGILVENGCYVGVETVKGERFLQQIFDCVTWKGRGGMVCRPGGKTGAGYGYKSCGYRGARGSAGSRDGTHYGCGVRIQAGILYESLR